MINVSDSWVAAASVLLFGAFALWGLQKWAVFRFEELMAFARGVQLRGEDRARIQRSQDIKSAFATARKHGKERDGSCSKYLEIETNAARKRFDEAMNSVEIRFAADRRRAVRAYKRRLPLIWRLRPKQGQVRITANEVQYI